MFAVVEHYQHVAAAQQRHEAWERVFGHDADPERGCKGCRYQFAVGEGRKIDDAYAVRQPGRIWSVTANATEVLPIPPGPVMVIRRCCASLVDNVSTTSARPNNRAMDSGGIGSGGAAAAGPGVSVATTSPTKA
jgi:hypothetical protein